MNYLRLGIVAAIAIAFISLGVYAWDADRALDACKLARIEDAKKALEEAARIKAEDEKLAADLRKKHDDEKKELLNDARSREDQILKSRVTVNGCPAVDAYINSVRQRQQRANSDNKSRPASK